METDKPDLSDVHHHHTHSPELYISPHSGRQPWLQFGERRC